MPKPLVVLVVAALVLAVTGCKDDENKRLAEQAERNLERQAAQELRNAELHREVAEGTKRLVEADALARQEIVKLHRDVQSERTVIGKQRDQLESDRREFAAANKRAPIIAESIKAVGLLFACVIPLLIALQILRLSESTGGDTAAAELLIDDLVSSDPTLISVRDQINLRG